MKQLLKKIQDLSSIGLCLLFLFINGFGTMESPQVFSKIMCFVVAIVGSIGSVKVYRKWESGVSDIQPTAVTWFGSFLFLLMGNTAMLSLFGN